MAASSSLPCDLLQLASLPLSPQHSACRTHDAAELSIPPRTHLPFPSELALPVLHPNAVAPGLCCRCCPPSAAGPPGRLSFRFCWNPRTFPPLPLPL